MYSIRLEGMTNVSRSGIRQHACDGDDESGLLLLLLLHDTRDVDVHLDVDGVVADEASVKQLLQRHELGKPCPAHTHNEVTLRRARLVGYWDPG